MYLLLTGSKPAASAVPQQPPVATNLRHDLLPTDIICRSLQVMLWSYPDVDRAPIAIKTEHAANIFGVKFLPCTNSQRIVTGKLL